MKTKSIFAFYYKLLAYKRGSYDDWWVMCSTRKAANVRGGKKKEKLPLTFFYEHIEVFKKREEK